MFQFNGCVNRKGVDGSVLTERSYFVGKKRLWETRVQSGAWQPAPGRIDALTFTVSSG